MSEPAQLLGYPSAAHFSRRALLLGAGAAIAGARQVAAQAGPRLTVLPKGIVSSIPSSTTKPPKHLDLEDWLLCNGALVYRSAYPELFGNLGPSGGPGDGTSTFSLPNLPVEYRDGQPVKGTAICPFSNFGTPAGATMPFDMDSDAGAQSRN